MTIPVGLLYSLTGSYGIMGHEIFDGAILAIEQINADSGYDFELRTVVMDPGGSLQEYARQCEALLSDYGVRHVIGCYTSAARKQILPQIEGKGAFLWHSAHYEGFTT